MVWRFSFSREHRIAAPLDTSSLPSVPFRLEPVTFVITMPAAILKPDVVHTLLNPLAQAATRDVAVVFIGSGICFHLAPRFFHFVQTADFYRIIHQEPFGG